MPHIFVRGGGAKGIRIVGVATWSGALQVSQIPIPAGTSPGDYLLAFVVPRNVSTNTAAPAGWTKHNEQLFGASRFHLMGKFYVDGDVAPTFSTASATMPVVITLAIRGLDPTNPHNASVTGSGTLSTTLTAATVNATVANTVILRFAWLYSNTSGQWPLPTWANGAVEQVSVTNLSVGMSVAMELLPKESTGATGTAVASISPSAAGGIYGTVVLAPAP